MVRIIFFVLFAVALVEGASVFFPRSHKRGVMGAVMEDSGLNSVQESNRRKIQQLDTTTGKDLTKIRTQMEDLALEQDKFLDTIHRQQQDLKDVNHGSQQQTQDLIEEEREKSIEQQQISQQRMQDEEQLIVDQRLRQNNK